MTADAHDLGDLNPAQVEAVTQTEGPLLVIAGAGSGKTRVITRRIAHLIRSGRSPETILAVTFTNKAAREMVERVESLVGRTRAWVSTFHSFGSRFLRGEADRLGRPSSFTLYDRSDSEALVKTVVKELELDTTAYPPRDLLDTISRWKSRLLTPVDADEASISGFEANAAGVYAAYEDLLRRNGAFDFDDLLCQTVSLLESDPELRARINERFRYVMVDEYQDVNLAQYRLTRLLGDAHGNVCVTGDPDQCIYAWRGAEIDYILDFVEHYPDAGVVRLEQNYRSVNNILRAASTVIRFNGRHGDKQLWSERGEGSPLVIRRVPDEIEEARAVVERVRTLLAAGAPRQDIAVFYRLNSLSLPLERMFLAASIPYQVVHGLEFFMRKEVKDVLAYLRYLINPDDEVSLLRILNVPARKIGAKTVTVLRDIARARRQSFGAVLGRPELYEDAITRSARAALAGFVRMIAELREDMERRASDFIRHLLRASTYGDFLEGRAAATGTDPLGNVEQLVLFAKEYDNSPGSRGLMGFLEEVSLFSDTDAFDRDTEKVSLMTVHSAKGLEFPHVIVVGLEEDLFPHRGKGGSVDIEEERRLFYVALTRARDSVTLLTTASRTRFGRRNLNSPSIFLTEIPEELTHVVDDAGGADHADLDQRVEYELDESMRIARGARVWHREFGAGTVVQVARRADDAKVSVDFDSHGRKMLMLRYAGLEPLDPGY